MTTITKNVNLIWPGGLPGGGRMWSCHPTTQLVKLAVICGHTASLHTLFDGGGARSVEPSLTSLDGLELEVEVEVAH